MKAKLPQSHFVSLSLASLEFCFASFSFSFALFREIWKHNLENQHLIIESAFMFV
jgi:hypothetical protein